MSNPLSDIGPARQRAHYFAGLTGSPRVVPTALGELEAAAQAAMSADAYAYVAGGAGAERTMAANRAAFDRWAIVPRMLRDVSARDLTVELFGRTLPAPVLLAPIGVLELAHRDADVAVARAASSLGVPMIFSNQASVGMERCAAAMGASPRWFQLYRNKSDELVASFLSRAEACGCEAVVVTLDTTMLGWRPRDLDLGCLPFLRGQGLGQYTSDPFFRSKLREADAGAPAPKPALNLSALGTWIDQARNYPGNFFANLFSPAPRAAVRRFMATYSRPSLTWASLPSLRHATKLPIVLKGVLHPDDARRALDAGVDGIVVSNHGGRQLDGAIASLDALPAIAEVVAGRVPVLLDSGVRTGADVFKALALGARAVLLGRPYVYGLACAGQAGVESVVANLLAEFDLTLGLAGVRTAREISRAAVKEC